MYKAKTPDDPSFHVSDNRRFDFLYVVQAVALAAEIKRPVAAAQIDQLPMALHNLEDLLSKAVWHSYRIPGNISGQSAAFDFLQAFLPEHVQDIENPQYEPAEWVDFPTKEHIAWAKRTAAAEFLRHEEGRALDDDREPSPREKARQEAEERAAAPKPPPPPPETEIDRQLKRYLRRRPAVSLAQLVNGNQSITQRQIKRQLTKMLKLGTVRYEGVGRGARWFVV